MSYNNMTYVISEQDFGQFLIILRIKQLFFNSMQ